MPVFIVYFALLAVAFFFLIVRPQRRQLAARRALIQAVDVGDEIITAGGIYGVIRSIEDDTMQVEIAPGVVLKLAREAVARRHDEPVVSLDDDTTTEGSEPTDFGSTEPGTGD
jgi:preprotein translocase subunit YajC